MQGLLLSLVYSEHNDTALFLWSFINKNIVLMDKMEIGREKLVATNSASLAVLGIMLGIVLFVGCKWSTGRTALTGFTLAVKAAMCGLCVRAAMAASKDYCHRRM